MHVVVVVVEEAGFGIELHWLAYKTILVFLQFKAKIR